MNAYKTASESIETQRAALIALAREAEAQVKNEAAAAAQIAQLSELAKMVENDPLLALIRGQAKLDEVVGIAALEAEDEASKISARRPSGFELGLRALEVLKASKAPVAAKVVAPVIEGTEGREASRFEALMQGHEKVESRGRDRLMVEAAVELALKERRRSNNKEAANKVASEAILIELGFDKNAPGFAERRKALTAGVWAAQEAWAKAHKKFEPRAAGARRPGTSATKKGTPRKGSQRAEKPEYEAEKPEYEDGGFEAPETWKDETPVIGVAQAAFEAAGIVPAPSLAPIQ